MNQNITLAENTLGQRIKAQRIKMGLTQEKLAELMCVPKPTISSYENDRIDIKGSVIVELANVLHTEPNYLLLGELKKEIDPFVETMVAMVQNIKDEKTKELLLLQMRAVSSI